MAEAKKENKKLKALLADLESGDEKKQLKAIKGLKVNGDVEAVEYLVFHLANSPSDEVKNAIVDILSSLKLRGATKEMALCLQKEEYAPIHGILLNTMWNSGLDYKKYLNIIVNVALDGEMMEAIECITIIENTSGPFEEEDIMEALLSVQEYLSNTTDENPKNEIIKEIAAILARINDSL